MILTGKGDPFLTGKLLLAMPALADPRFQKAVILMCAHDESGAMGLVINHPLAGLELGHLMEQIELDSPPGNKDGFLNQTVFAGGPVESARGFLLHPSSYMRPDTIRIDDSYGITGTVEALKAAAEGRGPDPMLFILGYAGWGAGQLDREIRENSWLTTEADPGLVFHPDPDEKWEMAIARIGINPAMLSGEAGRA